MRLAEPPCNLLPREQASPNIPSNSMSRLLQAPDLQCYVAGDDHRTPLCLPLSAQAPNNPACLCLVPLPLFFLLSLVITSSTSLRAVSLLLYTCARYEQQRRYPAQLHVTCSQRALDVRILETHSSPWFWLLISYLGAYRYSPGRDTNPVGIGLDCCTAATEYTVQGWTAAYTDTPDISTVVNNEGSGFVHVFSTSTSSTLPAGQQPYVLPYAICKRHEGRAGLHRCADTRLPLENIALTRIHCEFRCQATPLH